MELKSIKLVGFKSFADSTTISIRSHLTAIVGPNGCGKSNVVDAVRWVIGETSAKQLRGQSMSDVIFNGTTNRKPVGKAAVELLFDNSDGRIGGEFASFGEISVRREVEREGQSSYFLNGTACRRRDILSVFLGTGLGSRSYAIIEQGMISRLIEAKPEEMRTHLEEAAGISKYKDRRRDTENRMRRTQENLDRVNDIREELTTQLRRLKRQANAAERYKVLKDEETLLQAQIKALQWQELQVCIDQQSARVSQHRNQYDERLSQQRHVEKQIETVRLTEVECRDQEAEVQKKYYTHATDIARIEQQIKHVQEQTTSWESELAETDNLYEELTAGSEEQQLQIQELTSELDNLEPRSQEIKSQAEQAQGRLFEVENEMLEWQQQWESFQAQHADKAQRHEVTRTTLSHTIKQLELLSIRLEDLHANIDEGGLESLFSEIDPLSVNVNNAKDELDVIQNKLDQLTQSINLQRSSNQEQQVALQAAQKICNKKQAKLASLEALQQAALSDELTEAWLNENNLADFQRLGDNIQVDSGWEVALETVLGNQFQAICVPSSQEMSAQLDTFSQGEMTFIDSKSVGGAEQASLTTPLLLNKVKCGWSLEPWLQGIYAVDSYHEARELQSHLAAHESIVTKEGLWVGPNWLRIIKSSSEQGNVLQRKHQIDQLQQDLSLLENDLKEQEQALLRGEEKLRGFESERDVHLALFKDQSETMTLLQSDLSAKQSRHSELQQQQSRIYKDIDDAVLQQKQLEEQQRISQQQFDAFSVTLEELDCLKPELLQQRERLRHTLPEARSKAQASKQRADELGIRVVANENQLSLLRQTISRGQRQLEQLQERRDSLTDNLADTGSPLDSLSQQLQLELSKHVEVEQDLKGAKQALQELMDKLKRLTDERESLMKAVALFKDELQALNMKEQEFKVRQDTIVEQSQTTDTDLHETIDGLSEDASLSSSHEQADVLSRRISRLGPINLGAIEEFEILTERKDYLDSQYADLEEALSSLDAAIKKIDRETRSRFKETYEKVNVNFQEYFPKIFGGGRAYLELEENDLLTSGVLVKAQPPGKRNTTIHMLSGGEKALTAIALVFALFKINPAPFCILDEVDAPLDDVNVGRYCNIVHEMSDTTQFLVISHNKVTISMANQLMGVTMQEAGVSRIVSVDIEEAIEMAEV